MTAADARLAAATESLHHLQAENERLRATLAAIRDNPETPPAVAALIPTMRRSAE